MVRLQQVTRDDGVEAVMAGLADDGAVIVRDFIAAPTLRRFRDDIDSHADALAAGTLADSPVVQRFWGANTKRFTRLAHRSAAFLEFLADPLYLAVADQTLLPHATDYWMNTGQMMIVGPGERSQWLHRDAENWPSMCRSDGFEVTLSCMFAISEFTSEVGATRVVPGSHLWDDYGRKAVPQEVCQAVMPAGGGMIYTGRVLHGAGANETAEQWRHGMHLSYVLGWLTPEEAGPLGTSWEEVAHLPQRVQRLLGWRCSSVDDALAARLWTVDYEDVPVALGFDR